MRLEFKTKSHPESEGLNKDDKTHLGELLSGFSNAEGGLCVWGVSTQSEGGLDVAYRLQPISNVGNFKSCVDSLIVEYVSPAHTGIKTHVILSIQKEGSGYLIVEVPRSDSRPHMSNAAGHKKYFRRVGNTFRALEHYEVADLFNVQRSALLKPEIEFQQGNINPNLWFEIRPIVVLNNNSDIACRYPFANLQSWNASLEPMTPWDQRTGTSLHQDYPYNFYGTSEHLIHGHDSQLVARLQTIRFNSKTKMQRWYSGQPQQGPVGFRVKIRFGGENSPVGTKEFSYSETDIQLELMKCWPNAFGY